MNKEEAKQILVTNLKGSKRKPSPLLAAEAARFLIKDKEFGSAFKVASSLSVSRPTIEAFDKINDQPEEIKKLIQDGQIRIDQSTKLSSISDLKKRIEIAKVVTNLSAKDTRCILDYSKKHPALSAEESKKAAIALNLIRTDAQTVKVHLESENFDKLQTTSKKMGLSLEEACKIAVAEWLSRQGQS
jgi:ribosomal protein L14E/L6E/L27E